MIDSFGPRPTASGGHAASNANVVPGEKIVHRPAKKVLPSESVDRNAPTGPKPYFQHTYLERIAAFWPDLPDPGPLEIDVPARDEGAPARLAAAPGDDPAPPTVDIRA